MTNLWQYRDLQAPLPYGCDTTYALGMAWLEDLGVVEDWGCGGCYARQFLKRSTYQGVDGSPSPWTGVVTDLRFYRSQVDGIFMRHVLEHNHDWEQILRNAMHSFKKRMALIIFTPFAPRTHVIPTAVNGNGVPDISFAKEDLTRYFDAWREETLPTATQYGSETIFYIAK